MIFFVGIFVVAMIYGIVRICAWSMSEDEKEDAIHNETIENQTVETDNKRIDPKIWETLTKEQKIAFRKHERNRMTPKLRTKIKIRDNYTCKCCGRHMPDGFGVHIDHIIPISKGGLSVEENLQVLCIDCNLKKSNK